MNRFAELLDRLAFEPSRNGKLRLMTDYFSRRGDPERGMALAALTGSLVFAHAKPGLIRALIEERVDPALFRLSYDYVGDLSETVALLWPRAAQAPAEAGEQGFAPTLAEIVERLSRAGKRDLPGLLAGWLDALDETGRWALLKLITGSLRVGVSARLAKTAAAALGAREPDEIEEVWHGLSPPYPDLFAWLEGRGPRPQTQDPAPFRAPMLAHPVEAGDLDGLSPADFSAEWKWDGIRVQAIRAEQGGRAIARLYSRAGEDISAGFPDLVASLLSMSGARFALDGELLVVRAGAVQSFGALQQRLNRKSVSARLIAEHPAHVRAYDLLAEDEADLRERPFCERRARLEALIARLDAPALDLSPAIAFAGWDDIARLRLEPDHARDAAAIEGVMLKRLDSPYVPGRPKGLWWKWKRDPHVVDAVLMYAQRGHGKRSSYYSDFTFGVWRDGAAGAELTPVGKAYFGFTDAELRALDRYVRDNTVERFGPVRVVGAGAGRGLVLEIAFEGLNRSTRHKSGVAMRFPRIARIRWDKPASEADRLATLEAMLPQV
ncbi:MAG: cisplatin damage response ATP-dependent DNA ligase [Methylobacteriaceae bacterium]|nr:cisplatin damage response ATP-dependent DNA ligase [Methylobacteriaceae bacterium]